MTSIDACTTRLPAFVARTRLRPLVPLSVLLAGTAADCFLMALHFPFVSFVPFLHFFFLTAAWPRARTDEKEADGTDTASPRQSVRAMAKRAGMLIGVTLAAPSRHVNGGEAYGSRHVDVNDLADRSWPVLGLVMGGHARVYRATGGLALRSRR